MSRHKRKRRGGDPSRDGEYFVALSHVVLDSPGYRQAGHVARSLLVDVARQYNGKNNGGLVACAKYLQPMGWRSHDTITRALRELQDCGLLLETRKGARPNRPTWYALTWYSLHVRDDLDIDPTKYRRGAYLRTEPATVKTHPLPRETGYSQPL